MADFPLLVNEQAAAAQPGVQVTPNPTPEQQSEIAGAWKNWLGDARNRSAMMQFGISMMQPVGIGQTFAGHVGQALGSVGELAGRQEAMDLKAQETDNRTQLAEARSTAALQNAETRANAAADRSRLAGENLSLRRVALDRGTQHRIRQLEIAERNAATAEERARISGALVALKEELGYANIEDRQTREQMRQDSATTRTGMTQAGSTERTRMTQDSLNTRSTARNTSRENIATLNAAVQAQKAMMANELNEKKLNTSTRLALQRRYDAAVKQHQESQPIGRQAAPPPTWDQFVQSQPDVQDLLRGSRGRARPQAAPAPQGGTAPPASAINFLRSNPNTATEFDAKYGQGAAARILGQ